MTTTLPHSWLALCAAVIAMGAHAQPAASAPLVIQQQGSFAAGGTMATAPGRFDPRKPLEPAGQTYRGDHAYAFFQIPAQARPLPVVMWHGAGQFSRTWDTTADGREGFQTLFLRRISMGGHTGLWLGIHAGNRFNAIAVCNSAARIGTPEGWNDRAAMVREGGQAAMQTLAESSPGRWFSADFVKADPATVQRAQSWIAGIAPQGYAACCEALAASDLRADLGRITTPTLVLAGASDPVTTVADAQATQAAIPGARLAVVPASHLSNLEAPQAFDQAVLQFLATLEPAS